MDFLDQIDFENHNGVYLPMINDAARNQFYDRILTEVRDQDCVEIGFGTGFLSMLALKHGARSIVAYESDPVRYELGCKVIELLKLSDNKTFDFFPEQSFVGNHPYKGNDKSLRVLFKTNIDPEKTYTLTSYYQNKIKL